MHSTTTDDATRVYTSEERDWIPLPLVPKGEAWFKVIHADEELKNVIFKFRFSPGCELAPHTHHCHAIAYTFLGVRLKGEQAAAPPRRVRSLSAWAFRGRGPPRCAGPLPRPAR